MRSTPKERKRKKYPTLKKQLPKNKCHERKEKEIKAGRASRHFEFSSHNTIVFNSEAELSSLKNCRFGRHCQFLTTLNMLLPYYPTIVLFKSTHMIENLHLHQKKRKKITHECLSQFYSQLIKLGSKPDGL